MENENSKKTTACNKRFTFSEIAALSRRKRGITSNLHYS